MPDFAARRSRKASGAAAGCWEARILDHESSLCGFARFNIGCSSGSRHPGRQYPARLDRIDRFFKTPEFRFGDFLREFPK